MEERKLQDVAEDLGCSVTTVQNRYQRAFELIVGHPYSREMWVRVFGPLKLSRLYGPTPGSVSRRRPLRSPVRRDVPDSVVSGACKTEGVVRCRRRVGQRWRSLGFGERHSQAFEPRPNRSTNRRGTCHTAARATASTQPVATAAATGGSCYGRSRKTRRTNSGKANSLLRHVTLNATRLGRDAGRISEETRAAEAFDPGTHRLVTPGGFASVGVWWTFQPPKFSSTMLRRLHQTLGRHGTADEPGRAVAVLQYRAKFRCASWLYETGNASRNTCWRRNNASVC